MRNPSVRLAFLIAAIASIVACTEKNDVDSMSPSAKALIVTNAGITQTRDDWDDLQRSLPKDSLRAAAMLETYRAEHGLPFEFFLRTDAPPTIVAALESDDSRKACGKRATAFVTRFPETHPVFAATRALEFLPNDSIVTRWTLPADVALAEIVEGVVGDEMILTYTNARSGVYMRAKPNGTYRISADIPPQLPAEKWIRIADSTYLRVQPKDDIPLSTDPSIADLHLLGSWVAKGSDGTFVRTDSGLAQGTTAHAVTLQRDPTPRIVACPSTSAFYGMSCRGFPGEQRERLIAFPSPCS